MRGLVRQWLMVFAALALCSRVGAEEKLVFSAVEGTVTAEVARRVLAEAYAEVGIEIEIRELPGARALFQSNMGQTDGEAFRVAGVETNFPNLCRIEVPICSHSLYLFVREGDEFDVQGWASIPAGYRIGHQRGVQVVEKNARARQLATEPARNAGQLVAMLRHDRVDAIIEGPHQAALSPAALRLAKITRLEPAIHSHPLYHYIHKKHAALAPRITEVLRAMRKDGRLERIEALVMKERAEREARSGE